MFKVNKNNSNELIPAQCCISYRNQSFGLQGKTYDWCPCGMQNWSEMGHVRPLQHFLRHKSSSKHLPVQSNHRVCSKYVQI